VNEEENVNSEMSSEERLMLLVEIRNAVYGIVKSIFDDIDTSITMYTFKKEDIKLARVSKLRMQLKALRAEKLDTISNIGKMHEEKILKEAGESK
jgi:hypothetical protein